MKPGTQVETPKGRGVVLTRIRPDSSDGPQWWVLFGKRGEQILESEMKVAEDEET